MMRVLFVDDEENILQGLRRSMRAMRNEWEMEFVCGSVAALEAFEARQFDVIVSDMRMPGMDGAELLSRIRALAPGTIRIILSGHADPDAIRRAIPSTHQFLNKPCEPNELKVTIERATRFKALVEDDTLRQIVAGTQSLPVAPQITVEFAEAVRNEHSTLSSLAAVVERDIGLATRILQLANSAFFGTPASVTSIETAIGRLGLESISGLVLAHGILQKFSDTGSSGLNVEELASVGIRAGTIARRVAELEKLGRAGCEHAFLGGLLHDVGLLVLAKSMPEQLREYLIARAAGGQCASVETGLFGASQVRVGAYLLGIWGLPIPVVEAVAWQDQPSALQESQFSPAGAVHVALRLTAGGLSRSGNGDNELPRDEVYLEHTAVAQRWSFWEADVGALNLAVGG